MMTFEIEELLRAANVFNSKRLGSLRSVTTYFFQRPDTDPNLLCCLPFVEKATMKFAVYINHSVSALYYSTRDKHNKVEKWITALYKKYINQRYTDLLECFRVLIACILNEPFKSGIECYWAIVWAHDFCREIKQLHLQPILKCDSDYSDVHILLNSFAQVCENNESLRKQLEDDNRIKQKVCKITDYDYINSKYAKNKQAIITILLDVIIHNALMMNLSLKIQ